MRHLLTYRGVMVMSTNVDFTTTCEVHQYLGNVFRLLGFKNNLSFDVVPRTIERNRVEELDSQGHQEGSSMLAKIDERSD